MVRAKVRRRPTRGMEAMENEYKKNGKLTEVNELCAQIHGLQ